MGFSNGGNQRHRRGGGKGIGRDCLSISPADSYAAGRPRVSSCGARSAGTRVRRWQDYLYIIDSSSYTLGWTHHLRRLGRRGHDADEDLCPAVALQRVRVNATAPGVIKTPINKAAWPTPEAE